MKGLLPEGRGTRCLSAGRGGVEGGGRTMGGGGKA